MSGPRSADERLKRLLVLLPWLMEQGGEVPAVVVAERFGLTEKQLIKDLELVSMCGLPPFIDEMIDIYIDDGMVHVGVPRIFDKPLRLNAVEATELLAAAKVAMTLPGADPQGPLGRSLRKLATAVGEDDTGVLSVDFVRPPHLEAISQAVETHEQLRVAYYSASSDTTTERLIVPRQVYSDRGAWYVTAADDRSGETRTFRIDRIESLVATGTHIEPPKTPLPTPGEWFVDGSVERATITFDARYRGVLERFPADQLSQADAAGRVTAVVPVVNERWLATTLLRLGTDVVVESPAKWADLRARAAAKILRRYQ